MIRYTIRGVTFGELWFDERADLSFADVLISRHRSAPEPDVASTTFYSLITDLTASEDQIFAKIGKTCRYKIKRAETKDLATCHVDPAPLPEEIDAFLDFYARFAQQKGLSPIDGKPFSAAAQAGRLRLSRTELDGVPVVRHANITSGQHVRLLKSASLFRDSDSDTRAAIGRANRLLHWRDLLAFKEEGFRFYDWGGVFADETSPDRKGINDFKREFGAEPVEYYESTRPISLKGRVYEQLRSLKHLARSSLAVLNNRDDAKQVTE